MRQMIYWSKPTFDLNKDTLSAQIKDILRSARYNNRPRQITGALVFTRDSFIQVLEGPREFVEEVFAKISKDPRHRNVMVLARRERNLRDFSAWDMAFVPDNAANQKIITEYCGGDGFDPRAVSPERLFDLLKELVGGNVSASVAPLI